MTRLVRGEDAVVCGDVVALGCGESGIVLRVSVDSPEEDEVDEADEACNGEAPTPTYFDEKDADEGDADG